MNELPHFRLGGQERNFLLIEVMGRSHSGSYDYWDGNWLTTKISVQAGAFAGHFHATLRGEEFERFLRDLRLVYTSLGTKNPVYMAEFTTMEEQLSIVIRGDPLGNFVAQCIAVDVAGTGNRLEFELAFDQSYVPEMLSELEVITTAFPVLGNPSA